MPSRDFRREITDAVQSGDVAALSAIAYQLLGRVEQDNDRRARQADRKRRSRDVTRQPGTSQTQEMSRDVPGRHGTGGDVTTVVPSSLKALPTTPVASAQVIAKLGDTALQRDLDLLRPMFSREEWEDVAGFFLRRKYDRWAPWASVMLRATGPASQYLPSDLLQVCRDDALLDKRIGSEHVLLKFLAPVRVARVNAGRAPAETDIPRKTVVVEHWSDKKKREEREENDKQLARSRAGNVDVRRAKPDGEGWYARMLVEAKAAGIHPTLYAYDRMHEPAEVARVSA